MIKNVGGGVRGCGVCCECKYSLHLNIRICGSPAIGPIWEDKAQSGLEHIISHTKRNRVLSGQEA